LRELGYEVRLLVCSELPGLGRFSRVSAGVVREASRLRVLVADAVRIAAMLWSGAHVFVRSWKDRRSIELIYERVAVFQSLSSFHPAKRRALRIVEANAIMSRETAHDRKAIVLERLAATIERRLLRRADFVVAVTPAVGREVQQFAGVSSDRVLVLPNGTSSSLAETPLNKADGLRIGFVGSVGLWQRLDSLLDAFAGMGASAADVVIEIIGDGAELNSLKAHAAALGLSTHVEFTGRLPHDQAIDRMRSWAVGYAGHEQTWSAEVYHSPLKIYEYAALGMQVICSSTPDAEMLKQDGIAIHLFRPGSEGELSAAIASAVSAARSDTWEARASRRGIVRTKHSWEARVQTFLRDITVSDA